MSSRERRAEDIAERFARALAGNESDRAEIKRLVSRGEIEVRATPDGRGAEFFIPYGNVAPSN
jgi:hypothetical protein